MLEWVNSVVDRVEAEAKRDPDYLEWVGRQSELVEAYDALLERLEPGDRELILDYAEAREGMLYRMAQLAWRYGREHS